MCGGTRLSAQHIVRAQGKLAVSLVKTLQMFVIRVQKEMKGKKRCRRRGDRLEGADAGEILNWSAIVYKPFTEIYLQHCGVSLFIALIFQQFA